MIKYRKLVGLLLVATVAMSIVAVMGAPAMAKHNNEPNTGGVVVEEGDAPDCVGGSCGGVIVEDPDGAGPNCDWGNCGGSVCAGTDCGSCVGGNCGGSISGDGKHHAKAKEAMPAAAARQLPRTGVTLPMASTVALGLGLVAVGIAFLYMGDPSTRFAASALSYRARRRA